MKMDLTQEIVKEFLYYDPNTGVFTWKERDIKWFASEWAWKVWNKRFTGKRITSISSNGCGKKYYAIRIFEKSNYAHRIAFLYMNGSLPVGVDHLDGNGLNNKWENLREANQFENGKNTRLHKNNTSGVSGVHWFSRDSKWRVQIRINGKMTHIGHFKNFDDAVKVRKSAEIKYGYHPNHGKNRPL